MLYLIRHAHAVDGEVDPERPLSAKGRKQAERLGAFLRNGEGFGPAEYWHSPYLRARETAAILDSSAFHSPMKQVAGLEPGADPAVVARRLAREDRAVAIVGHNPHLSLLATLLVTGSASSPAFELRKCAILALEAARGAGPGGWVACWQVIPDLLP
jgi:phosphohistidine phosphatase